MARLVAAELRRVMARRLVRLTVVLTLIGVAVGGIAAFATTESISDSTYQQRVIEAKREQQVADAEIEACLRQHDVSRDEEVPREVAEECFPTEPIGEVNDPRFHRSRLEGILQGVSAILAVIGWALGASLVGAEFASRGMTTLLTWEPRRGRVFLAKTAAVILAVSLFTAAVLALVTLAMLPALTLHGAPLESTDPTVVSLAGTIGRGIALAALASGIGFAIATIGRNTAVALGAGFAYIIVFENILGSSIVRWRRWLLLGNVIVFVSGDDGGGEVTGRSVIAAAVFLTAVAVTLLAGAAAAFRTRDIA